MQDSNDSISVVRIRICGMVTGIFLFASPIYAQQYQRLPDSLNVGDTAVSNAIEAPADKITDTVNANSIGNEAIDWTDTVSFRTIPDSLNVQIKRNKLNAYANDPAYWMKDREEDENDFWQNFQKRYSPIILKGLLYFVLPAILIFALYKIFQNKSYIFYSRPKDQLTEPESELDIQQINFDEKISEAIQANDYRMAVRYMYLKTLKLVDEKGIITFRINGTNQDYLDQMAKHPGVKEFRFLTNSYEYAWYGEFPLSLAQFEHLRSSFDHYSKQF